MICIALSYSAYGYFQYLFFYWIEYYFEQIQHQGVDVARKYSTMITLGMGIGMLSGGGLIALYGAACLIAAAIIGLATAVPAWLAALLIGAALLAVAAATAITGRAQLKKAAPGVPEQAVQNVKADVEEVKESAQR